MKKQLLRALGTAAIITSLYAAPAQASWNWWPFNDKKQTTTVTQTAPKPTRKDIVDTLGCDPCKIDEKKRSTPSKSHSAPSKPKREWKPRGNPNILHKEYYKDADGAFCGTDDGITNAVKFHKWGLGPWQSAHSYRSETVPAPGTPADLAREMSDLYIKQENVIKFAEKYGRIENGMAYLDFQLNDNLYKPGQKKPVFTNTRNVTLEAPLKCDTTLDVIVCCDDEKTPPRTTPGTPTSGTQTPDAPSPDTPEAYEPWKNTTELTFGMGPMMHNVSSEIYLNTTRNPHFAPYQEVFQGTKKHFGIVRSTPNTIIGLQGAFVDGTDHPDNGPFAGCERYVNGQSVHAFGGLKKGIFYGLGGAELKSVEFGTAAGPVQFEEKAQDNITPYAHVGLMGGTFSGNHIRVGIGGVVQEIVEQDYRVPPTNQNRGDSMTEIMPIAEIAGQRFFNDGHVKGFFNVKAMMPKTLFSENENEVITDPAQDKEKRANGFAYNWRLGGQWYFTPTRPNSFYIGGELGGMHESTDFKFVLPSGERTSRPFDSHSMQGLVNVGYRWNWNNK